MKKNSVFGNNSTKKGSKVPTQNEWNQINNAITNVNYGDNNFIETSVDGYGTNIPSDSFSFPHIGEIKPDYITATIGANREENYYPYIDSLTVPWVSWILNYDGPDSINYFDRESKSTNVLFLEETTIEPIKPTTLGNGIIVGYNWDLIPYVDKMSGDPSAPSVRVEWKPTSGFIEDSQGSLYSEEYSIDNVESWGGTNTQNTSAFELVELVQDYITANPGCGYNSSVIGSGEVFGRTYKIPVARYDWDREHTHLDRCIQLLFGDTAFASGGGTLSSEFNHPFKGSISGDNIVIGATRESNPFDDFMQIYTSDNAVKTVEKPTLESIEITDTTSYVYYDIYRTGVNWSATLGKTTAWPVSPDESHLYWRVGKAFLSGGIVTWGQEEFGNPHFYPRPIDSEFNSYYDTADGITINGGNVYGEDWNGSVTGLTLAAMDATDVWFEITYTQHASVGGATVIAVGNMQSGVIGDKWALAGGVVTEKIHVGSTDGSTFTRALPTGSLYLHTTGHIPKWHEDVDGGNSYTVNMAAINRDKTQAGIVGDEINNPYLMNIRVQTAEFLQGDLKSNADVQNLEIYGTDDDIDHDFGTNLTLSGTNPDALLVLEKYNLKHEVDKGITQENEVLSGAVAATIPVVYTRIVTQTRYDPSSHELQEKTLSAYVLQPTAETDWTTVHEMLGNTVVSNVQVSGVTLQKKTKTDYFWESGEESSWTTWHTGTACPSGE